MKTIHKYPIPHASKKFSLILPAGFRFLRVDKQGGENYYLWVEVTQSNAGRQVDFAVYGTGHDIPDHAEYMTTYDVGPFVFHLYRI